MPSQKKIMLPLILVLLLCILALFYVQQNQIGQSTSYTFVPEILSEDPSTATLIGTEYKHLFKLAPNYIEAKSSASEIISQLINERPNIIIVQNNYHWQLIAPSNWFQASYVKDETEQYEKDVLVFTRKPWGTNNQIEPINVKTNLGANLIGYSVSPKSFLPNTPIYISLYWQALNETNSFNTVIQVISTVDGTPRAQITETTPRSTPPDYWEQDQIIEERITLTAIPETEVGSYQLNLSVRGLVSPGLLPLYQNNDDNVLDKVTLTHISFPEEIIVATSAEKTNLTFNEGIILHANEIRHEVKSNEIAVDLYWQVTEQPQNNYTVFVHLFDENGNFILGRDTLPSNGTYITSSWQPEQTIRDFHILPLPEGLEKGAYTVKVGMYDRATQARLSVEKGVAINDVVESNVTLGQIDLP